MNKIVIVFLLASIAVSRVDVGGQIPAVVGIGTKQPQPNRKPAYHNHPITPLLFETFDAASGYDLSGWGEVLNGGTVDENYTSTVLSGTQSLFIDGAPDDPTYTTNGFAANGHVWIYFQCRVISADVPPPEMSLVRLLDGGGATLMKVTYDAGDFPNMRIYGPSMALGYSPNGSITPGVTYHFWVEFNKNNGANAFVSLAFSTSPIRPTSGDNYVQGTEATSPTDVSVVMFGSPTDENGSNGSRIYDYLLIDDEQIGNYP